MATVKPGLIESSTLAAPILNVSNLTAIFAELLVPQNACNALFRQIEHFRDPFTGRPQTRMAVISLYVIISVFGAAGNFLVVLAVLRNPAMRTPRNYFVINLAVSDFIMCTITVPFTMVYLLDLFWQLGDALCRIVASLQGINVFVSTLSITAISLDRYLLIIFPTNPRLHRVVPATCFGAVWAWSILMALPMYFATSVHYPLNVLPLASNCGALNKYPMCREDFRSKSVRISYTIACFAFQYLVPLTTLALAYTSISLRLRKRLAFRTGSTGMGVQRRREEQRQSHTNTLIILIVAIFATVWLPLNIYITMVTFDSDLDVPEAFAFCHMFGMISACANPILYGVLNENFRKEFADILCLRRIYGRFFGNKLSAKDRKKQNILHLNDGHILAASATNYPASTIIPNHKVTSAISDYDERTPLKRSEDDAIGGNSSCQQELRNSLDHGFEAEQPIAQNKPLLMPSSSKTQIQWGESYAI